MLSARLIKKLEGIEEPQCMKEVESRVRPKPQARFGGGRTHAPERCDGTYPTLSQGFLALIALYHNTRPLPQRGNKTPLQLAGVDLGDDDWVRLIEHEMRYGQAAVQRI